MTKKGLLPIAESSIVRNTKLAYGVMQLIFSVMHPGGLYLTL